MPCRVRGHGIVHGIGCRGYGGYALVVVEEVVTEEGTIETVELHRGSTPDGVKLPVIPTVYKID